MKKYICLLYMPLLLGMLSGCGMGKGLDTQNNKVVEQAAASDTESGGNMEEEAADGDTDGKGAEEAAEETEAEEADGEETEESAEDRDEKPLTMAELIGGTGQARDDEEPLPETVLWFNATYAPLTYSNSWNWRLVGGLRPTEENRELSQMLLLGSWGVTDRKSALETVERLKEEGHRAKCRECMEQLKEMELMGLGEEDFLNALLESEIEEELVRYIIAYSMYHDGVDADYIAAWDLCRVNQLYADFYISGYMTYEEAMDASLENSLVLQKMYPSWEEMVSAYMLGYQFWQSDPCTTEDSPTLERYHYYEMLCAKEDGPYSLDWKMQLKKSW